MDANAAGHATRFRVSFARLAGRAPVARVLVMRGGAIGDFVLTLPILEAIRLDDRDSEVEILGYPSIAELAVGRRLAAAARRVDGTEWAPLFSLDGELADAERDYLAQFDRVFCVWPDADGVLRENLRRSGACRLTYVNPMPPADWTAHVMDYMARQCRATGLEMEYLEPHLYPAERDAWWAERYMRVIGAGHAPLLGLHPGSGSPRKNWPARRYAAVAQDWMKRHHGHVLVAAGPADDEPLGELTAALDEERAFVLQNESLPRVAAVLQRCAAFVGNDSGITHIAAAVRTRTVAIFGPTDPRVWRPLAPRVRVVSPAGRKDDLASIPADVVVEAVESLVRGEG